MKPWLTLLAVALGGCTAAPAPPGNGRGIVSLDFCADQYVLRFVDRTRIAAVSPDAGRDFSFMRDKANGLHRVRARTEEILALRPEAVVRSYGGEPGIDRALARAGIRVIQLGYPETLADVRRETLRISAALGAADEGLRAVAEFDRQLAAARALPGSGDRALYLTPGGATTGPDTLAGQLMEAAGLRNMMPGGWQMLPLERVARSRPDRIVLSSFAVNDRWSTARHAMVQRLLADVPVTRIDGAQTACGAWFTAGAALAMAGPAT